jgi:prenyl protein peptidase
MSTSPMEEPETSFFTAVSASCLLGMSYVLSLYVWSHSTTHDRDHPSTIKRRFVSAFCMLFISPPFVWAFGSQKLWLRATGGLAQVIGFRWDGFFEATVLPLALTVVLFAGPIAMACINDVRIRLLMMPHYWAHVATVSSIPACTVQT